MNNSVATSMIETETSTPRCGKKKIVETCTICADVYNKSTRCKTQCPYCEFFACSSCWQTHFINETQPTCMNTECKREWTRNSMREKLTNAFIITKYKKHMEEVLYEKEKALMPATQALVEQEIEYEKYQKKISDINAEITNLMEQKRRLEINHIVSQRKKDEEGVKKTFVRACSKENCRGFLSTQWKCGICETWTCPECHENKGLTRNDDHVCNPDTLATAKLISSDSRPCPSCRTVIFKIDGCDQMFCTMCHTAFSWRTGRLETNIHNPHYFEWVNRNGGAERNPLDIQCGREMTHYLVNNINTAIKQKLPKIIGTIDEHYWDELGLKNSLAIPTISITLYSNVIRNIMHLQYVIMQHQNNEPNERNQRFRINYMRSKMSEDEFKYIIQKEDKKYRKDTELSRVYQLLRDVVTDIIYRFYEKLRDESIYDQNILNEIVQIVDYVNDCLKEIGTTYNCVQYKFNYLCVRYKVDKVAKKTHHFNIDDDDSIE